MSNEEPRTTDSAGEVGSRTTPQTGCALGAKSAEVPFSPGAAPSGLCAPKSSPAKRSLGRGDDAGDHRPILSAATGPLPASVIPDAILITSFGGPEKPEDVLPFLQNVTRGRGIPEERLRQVAEHYHHFGGKSPINDQCRELIHALRQELDLYGIDLPIYWGNRNWHPLLPDTLRQMRMDGVRFALAFVTSAYSSYSGCRQYRENLAAAQLAVGPSAPHIEKVRVFYNHPGFVAACADRVRDALEQFSSAERSRLEVVATAHSIPCSMANTSAYEEQLRETARLVAEATGLEHIELVFQSRSGPPVQPWLEPDVLDHLRSLHAAGTRNVLLAPLGFTSDHLEVL